MVLGWEVAFIRGMILPSSRDRIVHDLGHHLGGDSSLRVRLRRDRWPLFCLAGEIHVLRLRGACEGGQCKPSARNRGTDDKGGVWCRRAVCQQRGLPAGIPSVARHDGADFARPPKKTAIFRGAAAGWMADKVNRQGNSRSPDRNYPIHRLIIMGYLVQECISDEDRWSAGDRRRGERGDHGRGESR